MKKMPPIEKVFEAWTAIADHRIELHDGYAAVASSDDTKAYTVRFDGDTYSSDDNATYWQGYPGYPVIATLMLQGRLPLDREEVNNWRGINWKEINTKYRNRYSEAVSAVAAEKGIDLQRALEAASLVMEALKELNPTIKRKI